MDGGGERVFESHAPWGRHDKQEWPDGKSSVMALMSTKRAGN